MKCGFDILEGVGTAARDSISWRVVRRVSMW